MPLDQIKEVIADADFITDRLTGDIAALVVSQNCPDDRRTLLSILSVRLSSLSAACLRESKLI